MKTIKNTLKSELVFDDNETRRYLLRLEWDKEKPKACVIMLSAGTANGISLDHTTNYVLENLLALGYGSVEVLNLFSNIKQKTESAEDAENLKAISSAAKKADIIILASGSTFKTNSHVKKRQLAVLEILSEYQDNLYCIANSTGQKFYHPLCPSVRKWNLQKFDAQAIIKEMCNDD